MAVYLKEWERMLFDTIWPLRLDITVKKLVQNPYLCCTVLS